MSKKKSLLPGKNPPEKDCVMTPDYLAVQIVEYFQPFGSVFDPCAGEGAFVCALLNADRKYHTGIATVNWTEINPASSCYTGVSFFDLPADKRFCWIISNPPYSILTPWLEHSFELAHNVVYLIQATAPFFTSRRNAARHAGYAIKEMLYVDCPDEWKRRKLSFGTGLAAVHWQRGWTGGIRETDVRTQITPRK